MDQKKCNAIALDLGFSKILAYSYGLKEDLIVRLHLNSSKKVILCSGGAATTNKLQTFLENLMQYLTKVMQMTSMLKQCKFHISK